MIRTMARPVPRLLVALSMTRNAPASDAVPLIRPVDGSRFNPDGKPVAANPVGSFTART